MLLFRTASGFLLNLKIHYDLRKINFTQHSIAGSLSHLPLFLVRTKVVKRLIPRNREKVEVKERKKINEELHYIPELLLIDQDKKVIGKKTYHEAISLARMNKLELVLVQENADPPVARLMSQTDPIFVEIKNALQEKPTRMKEIQFTEVTDEHDIQTKVNKLRNLLTKGHKVRVIINFKHKENFDAHTAHEIMNDILNRVDDISLRDSKTGLKFLSGGSAYSILIPKTETTTSLEKQPSTTQEKASTQQQQPQPQPQPQQQKQQPPKQQPQEKQQKQKPQVVASQISKTSDVDRLSIEHSTKQTEKEKKKKKAKRDEEIEEAEDFEEESPVKRKSFVHIQQSKGKMKDEGDEEEMEEDEDVEEKLPVKQKFFAKVQQSKRHMKEEGEDILRENEDIMKATSKQVKKSRSKPEFEEEPEILDPRLVLSQKKTESSKMKK